MNDPRECTRRLVDLLRREHAALADFLVALADFNRQRLWLRLGYPNLFDRKVAARLVQRFPEVVEPLRDGRLCFSSILELAKVLTESNRAETIPRFFHCSKQEAKAVAVEILPAEVIPRRDVVTALPLPAARPAREVHPDEPGAQPTAAPATRDVTVPLTPDLHRLHMTVSKAFLDKLDRARAGQSHAQPGASREQILEAALDLMLEQQARRRAEVKRPQKSPRPASPDHLTAAVRREVWSRDQGKCQWPVAGGGTCGSTLRLEVDHVVPRPQRPGRAPGLRRRLDGPLHRKGRGGGSAGMAAGRRNGGGNPGRRHRVMLRLGGASARSLRG
jgi:5-methylcytosine-specific restriction endonuclease McrA